MLNYVILQADLPDFLQRRNSGFPICQQPKKVPESAEIDARKTEILTVQLRDDKPVSWSVGFSRSTRTD
jgi:hypothetical protein